MQSRIKIENPEAVQITVTLTMSGSQWGKFRDQMAASAKKGDHPMWEVSRMVDDLLGKARATFWAEPEKENP